MFARRIVLHPGRFHLIVSVIVVLGLPVVAAAQCPTNTVSCVGVSLEGDVEFDQTEMSTDPAHSVSYNLSSAAYDLPNGTLSAVVTVDDVYMHRSVVIADDVFELHGASSALLKVRLNLSLFWLADPSGRTAWAGGYARLTAGGQSVETSSFGPEIDPLIELEIAVAEGQRPLRRGDTIPRLR
ncbi:MAG: hypothetical protein P8181_16190 [bacterium]